jgi:hypothetical protein
MPAAGTRGLTSDLQYAYTKALQVARVRFGRCRAQDLGGLVVPFVPLNWARYRHPRGSLSAIRVGKILHVLRRFVELVPDSWWWRHCAAEASAINVLLRPSVVASMPLGWISRVLRFVEAVLPKEHLTLEVSAITRSERLEIYMMHPRCAWKLVVVVAARRVPLLALYRMTPLGPDPLLVGTWSREFWIRVRDLLSEAQGFTPLAQDC